MSLAGNETSITGPGYLAGALDAAERATDETLARLRGPRKSVRAERSLPPSAQKPLRIQRRWTLESRRRIKDCRTFI
jgi:hypothetical protein